MVNREVCPLLAGIFVPILIVLCVILYTHGYDFTKFFRELDIIYYIIILPIALGLVLALMRCRNE